MRLLGVLFLVLIATPVQASHDWFGVDLCRSRPMLMPPGLDPTGLPDPDSEGAQLVARHCVQCHQLPGPGHHTAAEWTRVTQTMFKISEATARFGGRPGLLIPDDNERTVIADYLKQHALRPLPAGQAAPVAYLDACGDCHAAPDPAIHPAAAWPAVIARMAGHRAVMAREPLDQLTAMTALAFVSKHAAADTTDHETGGRWVALGPVFLLAAYALWRLARGRRA